MKLGYFLRTVFFALSVVSACAQPNAPVDSVSILIGQAKRYTEDSTNYSIALANRAVELASKGNNKEQYGYSLLVLAEGYLYNDYYDLSVQRCFEALELFKLLPNQDNLAQVYGLLGWVYFDIQDFEEAILYHRKTTAILNKSKDYTKCSAAINAVGLCNLALKKFDSAQLNFLEAYRLGLEGNDKKRQAVSISNLGDLSVETGDYKHADSLLNLADEMFTQPLNKAEVYNSLANLAIHQRNYIQAILHLEASRELIGKSKSTAKHEFLLRNAQLMASAYEKLGDTQKALEHYKEYQAVYNRILSDAKKRNLAVKVTEFQRHQKESEIRALERLNKLRLNQRNWIALAIILVCVLGFFVYSRERQLRLREHELYEAREALAQAELIKAELEKKSLADKLEFKNRELTNYAIHISQRNELQRVFLSELESFKTKANSEQTAHINRVIKQFSTHEEINQEAEEFHVNVELENRDFFFNLSQRYPDLTENEKRLCAQVRLNLSIKDIASVNNISVKAVEMARYRLRKKMGLAHDENLIEFLNKV